MNYKLCELYNKYAILSKYEQNTHFIEIASCFRWREWDSTAQQFWWSWVFAHLRGYIADDAMQMDVHKRFILSILQGKFAMLR